MAKDKYTIKNGEIELLPVKPDKEDFSKWDIIWEAYERNNEKRKIATVNFNGEPDCGSVELSVNVEDGFKLHVYAKEAVRTMMDWALDQKDIYEVKCQANAEDEVVIDAVQRAGFIFRNCVHGIDYYTVDKQRTAWTALYLIIGFAAGLLIGVTIGHMVVGLGIGLFVGISIGAIMDAKAMEERASVTKHQYIAHWQRAKQNKKNTHVEDIEAIKDEEDEENKRIEEAE